MGIPDFLQYLKFPRVFWNFPGFWKAFDFSQDYFSQGFEKAKKKNYDLDMSSWAQILVFQTQNGFLDQDRDDFWPSRHAQSIQNIEKRVPANFQRIWSTSEVENPRFFSFAQKKMYIWLSLKKTTAI